MQKIPEGWTGRIEWLKDQAGQAYVWNKESDYWEVRGLRHSAIFSLFRTMSPTQRLSDAFQYEAAWQKKYASLPTHPFMRQWAHSSEKIQKRIADFFEERSLSGFNFFDHGGRAIVFRARDEETGRYRIARLEANTGEKNRKRVVHPTVLPVYATNEDDLAAYEGIKLEIMAEIVPLHKLPGRPSSRASSSLKKAFDSASYEIARGTNLTYPDTLFDKDAENHNVGLLPDGKIVAFDTYFHYGPKPQRAEWKFSEEHKIYAGQLYGMQPCGRFF